MSKLQPDIFSKKKDKKSFFIESPIDSFVEKPLKEEPTITIDGVRDSLDDLIKGFPDEEAKMYKYCVLSAKLAVHPNDSGHYLHLFKTAFISSLKKTFPEKDIDDIEKALEQVEILLEKRLKEGNLPNTIYPPCLMGMVRGLI